MLTDLIITNFAIIDRLEVSFAAGFNVLTGETGAGKSIVIDAVGLLLGDRARPDLIRTGEDAATVEAVFALTAEPALRRLLQDEGFDGGDELLVRRVISRSGRNRVYLNGNLATLAQLQSCTAELMAINGQHEHQFLQRVDTHLPLLDRYADLEGARDSYQERYAELKTLRERLEALNLAEREREQRLDLLSFQSRDIAQANLQAGEEEVLSAERLRLQHAEQLAAVTGGGFETLYGAEGAVCERLGLLARSLADLASADERLGGWAETVNDALYALEDVAGGLRDYARDDLFDPRRLQEVDDRLALLAGLKRKYGPTVEAILAFAQRVEAELAELADTAASRDTLLKGMETARVELLRVGEELSRQRRQAARTLAERVEGELADLAMARARFQVQLTALPEPGPRGLERGEFYLSPNPGEEPKPLSRIASGGELSRIMLALKRAAPAGDRIPTLVFDEVDAGIGGQAATAVGEKLRAVALGRQVLCVTHLPQVAAYADHHYRVEKQEASGRTATSLVVLDPEERVREMARMLGGAHVTARTLDHARELVEQSMQATKNI